MGEPTRWRLRVRYFEVDEHGHVNHANYVHYLETARIEALEAVGLSLQEMRRGSGQRFGECWEAAMTGTLAAKAITREAAMIDVMADRPIVAEETRTPIDVLSVTCPPIGTAATGAVMGNPAESLAGLGNRLAESGLALEEGDPVLSGALIGSVRMAAGDVHEAAFGGTSPA